MLGLDRATVIRRVIEDGLFHERINKAIDLYQKCDTMELAANKTGLSIWDVMDVVHERGIRRPVDLLQIKKILIDGLDIDEELKQKILDR